MTLNSRWISITAFCSKYGLPVSTVRRYCKAGSLPCRQIGKLYYIDWWGWSDLVADYNQIEDETELLFDDELPNGMHVTDDPGFSGSGRKRLRRINRGEP